MIKRIDPWKFVYNIEQIIQRLILFESPGLDDILFHILSNILLNFPMQVINNLMKNFKLKLNF